MVGSFLQEVWTNQSWGCCCCPIFCSNCNKFLVTNSLLYSSRILSSSVTACWRQDGDRHLGDCHLDGLLNLIHVYWPLTASSSWLSGPIGSRGSPSGVYRERSINLQDLENSDPIIASRKGAVVRSYCSSVYWLLKERLLAPDIFSVKVSSRNSLVQLVTGTTLIGILSFAGASSSNRGSLWSIPSAHKVLLVVFLGEEPLLLFSDSWEGESSAILSNIPLLSASK